MSSKILPKWAFYLLSWTWGIIMTLIGHAAAGILLLLGYRPQKNCYGWIFEVGYGYGGIDLGYISIVCKDSTQYLKDHEFGHSVQNCFFGPLFPFLVAIPSMTRYWYREWRLRTGKGNPTGYYDIWFEKQASDYGIAYREHLEKDMG